MTLDTSLSRAIFKGNGISTEFPFNFKVWDKDQIKVSIAKENEKAKEVKPDAVWLSDKGGTVVYRYNGSPLPMGYTLAITRSMPFIQEDQYITGTRIDPHVFEEALDIACAERQELREKQERALVVPITSGKTPDQVMDEILDTAARANEYAEKTEQIYQEVVNLRDNAETIIIETGDEQVERVVREGDRQAARAAAEADRAENAADIAALTHYVSGAEDVLTLERDIPAGSLINLPPGLEYLVGRHHLRVGYDGVIMSPSFFEEIGAPGTASTQVRILFPLYKGQELDFWIIPLGEAGEILTEIRAEAAEVQVQADRAEHCASEACACADAAEGFAERAERVAIDAETFAGFSSNDVTWTLTEDVSAGSIITFPEGFAYLYGKKHLHLSYDGVVLSRSFFREVGDEEGAKSTSFIPLLPLTTGQELFAWITPLGREETLAVVDRVGVLEKEMDAAQRIMGTMSQDAVEAFEQQLV